MTKGQEESDDLVVPEDDRKAVQSAGFRRGGKEVTANEVVQQLGLFRETADNPRGNANRSAAGAPAAGGRAEPKSRTKKNTSALAVLMTMEEVAEQNNLRRASSEWRPTEAPLDQTGKTSTRCAST